MPGRALVHCGGERSHHLRINCLGRVLIAGPDALFVHGNSFDYAHEFGEHFGLVLLYESDH